MTVKQLKEKAKELGLKGYSKMNKAELVEAIETIEGTKIADDLAKQIQKDEFHEMIELAENGAVEVDDQFFNKLNRSLNAGQPSLVQVIEKTYNIQLHEDGVAETTYTKGKRFVSEIAPLSAEEFANTPIQKARNIIEQREVHAVAVEQHLFFDHAGLEKCLIEINIYTRDCVFSPTIEVHKRNNVEQCDIIFRAVYEQICKYYHLATCKTHIIEKEPKKMKFYELEKRKDWKKAVLVFTEDSFQKKYSLEARSYYIYSDCKYFDSNMGGSSLYGYCLDGSDQGVRLDKYFYYENWKVDYCYIVDKKETESC